jgi:hypothetical protein
MMKSMIFLHGFILDRVYKVICPYTNSSHGALRRVNGGVALNCSSVFLAQSAFEQPFDQTIIHKKDASI